MSINDGKANTSKNDSVYIEISVILNNFHKLRSGRIQELETMDPRKSFA